MRIEEIGDPIGVLAVCARGKIEPKRFKWNGRSYTIDQVNGQWIDRRQDGYSLHYSVQAGDETYYLHFSSSEVQWWLDQVVLAG